MTTPPIYNTGSEVIIKSPKEEKLDLTYSKSSAFLFCLTGILQNRNPSKREIRWSGATKRVGTQMENILIADDEEAIIELITAKLKTTGYNVSSATNGRKVLDMAKKNLPDLILLDILMPEIDGFEVCRQLKADIKTRHIPVIFLTGKLMERDVIKGLELGAADYVIKPFSPRELAIRLRGVLDVKDKTSAPISAPVLTHLEQKIDALAVLQNVSTAMNSIHEIDELLFYIFEQSLKVANAKHGSVMLLDDQKVLRITAAKGLSQKVIDQTRIRLSEGISGSVAAIGKPLLIANIEEDAKFKRRSREKYETKSLVCVPIKTRDQVIGVLNVNNKQSGDVFNQDDLEILALLANQAGVAIENAELYKSINENLSEYKILEEAISRVVNSQNWDDMLDGLLTQATSTTSASVGMLFLVDEKSDELYVETTAGSPDTSLEQLRYKFGEGTIGVAAKKSESVIINHWNGEKDPLRKQVRNLIGCPLSANHKTFGYFVVGNKAQNGDFDKADLSRLNTLSGEVLSVLHSNNIAAKSGTTKVKENPENGWLSDDSSEFCSTVAHELKAPLTSIQGFNEILRDQLKDEINTDQQNYFSLIDSESTRLSNLIQNLLNITTIENTSSKHDRRPTELNEVIDEAVWLLTAKLSDFKVRVEVPEGLPPAIVDRDKVSQILINLLGNAAVYATAKSEITVTVSDEPDQFVISVSDLGVGVGALEHEMIFQKFYRADNDINRKTPGTGLGLSIVKQLVEMQGGQISVESDINKGAKFVFTLPKNM